MTAAVLIRNREEAAKLAEAATRNKPGTCQLWVRNLYLAPSVGDFDGDGDADAVDGWKSEPANSRFTDRNAPRGTPGAFSGGSNGLGHRVISLGHDLFRSTDMYEGHYRAGYVGNATIPQIEVAMGVKWLGWSKTISGIMIPLPPKVKTSRGQRIDKVLREMREHERDLKIAIRKSKNVTRVKQLTLALGRVRRAIKDLEKVPLIR